MDQKVKRLVEAVEDLLNNLDSQIPWMDENGWEFQGIGEVREAAADIRKEEQEIKDRTFTILWPLEEGEKERIVSAAWIESQYRDAVSNKQVPDNLDCNHPSPARMGMALHEAGLITLKHIADTNYGLDPEDGF